MNRLQKKCLIAAAGTHLLLLVVLFCSAFVRPTPPPDNTQVLEMIPSAATDKALSSGVREAQPPPPAPEPPTPPVVQPPTPPTPTEPPPPDVKPPEPVKQSEPVKPPEVTEPPVPNADVPTAKPKPQPHKVVVDLKEVVRKTPTVTDNHEAEERAEKAAEKAAEHAREVRAKAFNSALSNIKTRTSSSTTIDMPGDSTVAYANYGAIVKSIYTAAWRLPETAANDEANVKVSVTIARDGRVTESHIIDRSGDPSLDRSIQNTLDRVTEIRPFPDDSTDKERTYIINFNLKAKRQMLG
jgi:TonB family protein